MIVVSDKYTKREIQTRTSSANDMQEDVFHFLGKDFYNVPPLSFKLGPNTHLAGQSFSLADVTVFPTVATLFRFGWVQQSVLVFFLRGCTDNVSHLTTGGASMSPPLCPAGCLLSVTRNWESTTLCWRSGQASNPAGLLIGWRIRRDKKHWKTSEIHQNHLHLSCFGLTLLL